MKRRAGKKKKNITGWAPVWLRDSSNNLCHLCQQKIQLTAFRSRRAQRRETFLCFLNNYDLIQVNDQC